MSFPRGFRGAKPPAPVKDVMLRYVEWAKARKPLEV
eukprot:CAMPEP_0197675342 /NCGR_PEP_ID=MMETSP1338-20131121/84776_1 /TAXON_ID=43686 ORGANISM="Pelagodinium beii, Strain RCC1491" /NCGR_SAMPLE_ID=MMETSP1338 /ASSEMBLY_ACC=CAM_ASM_000754 /LENGTH=35 /DNA_ID= /DNA_START= /DNA_END= /DNA_ORIENTATION=